jgi:SPP1 family phage portal protein
MSALFPFQGLKTDGEVMNQDIIDNADNYMNDKQFILHEVNKFKNSDKRKSMIDGERYYEGYHDILNDDRTFIGAGGQLQVAHNLPNHKIVDNQYAKFVDQKVNYQVGKPFTIDTENETYQKELENVLDKSFRRTLKNVMTGTINMGLSWLYVYYNSKGELSFKRIPAYQIIPFYNEENEDELDFAIRVYTVTEYTGQSEEEVEKVELYTKNGIFYYINSPSGIIDDVEKEPRNHFEVVSAAGSIGYNWDVIPLIPFRFNQKEIPLIVKVKGIQDALNKIISMYQNNMLEDSRNTIIVIKNYDGQDLGEFRRNLMTYNAVKVREHGEVSTLEVKVNSQNYESIVKMLKNAIVENARGFDAKDERMSNNPNQMNIQSMYSDIELDANGIDTEFQAAFDELLWFVDTHLMNTGKGDFFNERVEIVFNRDMLSNEAEIIENLAKSTDLSLETRLAQHPYVRDVKVELERRQNENKELLDSNNPYLGM